MLLGINENLCASVLARRLVNDSVSVPSPYLGVGHVEHLAVLSESAPVCQNNMTGNEGTEGDHVEWSCEVGFKGMWAPSMEWTNSTGVIKSEYQNTSDTVKCSFVMQLRPSDDGRRFSCRTFFDEPKPGSMEAKRADNIISTGGLFDVYTSQAIIVNCKFSFCTLPHIYAVGCLVCIHVYTYMCAF